MGLKHRPRVLAGGAACSFLGADEDDEEAAWCSGGGPQALTPVANRCQCLCHGRTASSRRAAQQLLCKLARPVVSLNKSEQAWLVTASRTCLKRYLSGACAIQASAPLHLPFVRKQAATTL